ncbi:endothelin-converting enzyme 1-like [Amblyomma americanum]
MTSADTAAVGSCLSSPASSVSDGVYSGALSIDSPLSSSPGNVEQPPLVQPPGFRGNPPPGEDRTKSPPDSQKLKSRLGLTLAVLGVTVLVTLVALAIASLVWRSPAHWGNTCKTHACLAYSTRLLASINESVDPCQSFTHFVCDGWRQKNRHTVWNDQFISLLDKVTASLKSADVPASGQDMEQRAAIMYRSCVDVLEGERDELPAVKNALVEAGIVWPKPSKGADVLYTLLCSSLKLGWDVLLDFDVAPDGSGINLVSGKFLYFVVKRYRDFATGTDEEYFQFLKERFQPEGEDTVTFQETDASVETALSYLSNARYEAADEYNADVLLNLTQLGLTEVNWTATLLKLDIRMNSSLTLTTTSPRYLERVLYLWWRYGTDSFHTLISWCTVQVAALFANKDLIFNYYNRDYQTTQAHYKIFCVTRAMLISGHTLFDKYYAEALQSEALNLAKSVAQSVRTAFFRRLSNWTYFDESINVISNWSSSEIVFRKIEHTGEEILAADHVPDLNISFVRNWQQSVHVRKDAEFGHMLDLMQDLEVSIVSYDKRDFELMPYALSFPLFDPQLHSSLNYGGLGAQIAFSLASLFLSAYYATNASFVEPLMDCLKAGTYGSAGELGYYAKEVIGYGALVDAYNAQERALDSSSLFGLEKYSGLQLFFIALCYVNCYGGSENTNHESICTPALQHMPQFAKAFNCTPGDPMNPSKQCRLF